MLHEVLLALSGHPSPVLENVETNGFPLLTPAESVLLSSLGRLATLHRALRSHLPRISAHHPSMICRALATSILSTHLTQFQNLILETERQIISKDSTSVGAYDIVPLAGIVSRFEPWKRKLDWYWEIACFLYSADAPPLSGGFTSASAAACTGAEVLNKLRVECKTGYPDIEEPALALLAIAEQAWKRQLSNWLLHYPLSQTPAAWDFLIVHTDSSTSNAKNKQYTISPNMIPSFVTKDTANTILFIGRTIQMFQNSTLGLAESTTWAMSNLSLDANYASLIPKAFLQKLAQLRSPIIPATFSSLVSDLRAEIAAKVVHRLLPTTQLMRTFDLLKQYMLAGRTDFMDMLIAQADNHIAKRHSQSTRGLESNVSNNFVGVVLKEAEVKSVLAQTWTAIAPAINQGILGEEEAEWARDHLSLEISRRAEKLASQFDEFLLYTPTALVPRLESAFDLFLEEEEAATYSTIQSYLLAVRRGHNHLSDLWRQTWCRRDHPAPIRRGRASKAFPMLRQKRRKIHQRMQALRTVWSISNAALRTLVVLGDYMVGEVVEGSWNAFHAWATQVKPDSPSRRRAQLGAESPDATLPHDPELIAQAHRQYMAALLESLLLNDETYTKTLKSLLTHVDEVVALVKKLGTAQRSIDLHDEGVMDGSRVKYEEDEKDTLRQLAGASQNLEQASRRLKEHLRDMMLKGDRHKQGRNAMTGFEPYSSSSGLDRLLMRLEPGLVVQVDDTANVDNETVD